MESKAILKQFDLRNTPSRLEILRIFEGESKALSQSEIEVNIPGSFDRVTVYRTLRTFLKKGILHKVLDDEGTPKYALCGKACEESGHSHDHVHFKCNNCGRTTCLEHVHVPTLTLPKEYKADELNVLVQGLCPTCQ